MPESLRARALPARAVPTRAARVRRGVSLGLLPAVLVLAGCAPQEADPAVANAGYEAGDGSYTSWAPDSRSDAIDLTATTYDGEDVSLADLRGEVVVLNYWYAACPPCRVEAEDLESISNDYAEQGVRFLGVNGRDDAATAEAFNDTFGVTYPSIDDRDAAAVAAMEGAVPLNAVPTTVVLDSSGRPAARILGIADDATLRGILDDTLAEG